MIQPVKITHAPFGSWIAPEYSSVDCFSRDNFYLLLIAVDHFQLYTRDGQFLQDLPIGASERPRWSQTDSGVLTYLRANLLVEYNVALGIRDTHPFPESVSVDDAGEADTQHGKRVLCGVDKHGAKKVFVYDILLRRKGLLVLETLDIFNNLLLTPSGSVLIDGMYLYQERDGQVVMRQVFGADGHKCVTRYKGRDVLLITNSNENPVTQPDFPNGIVMVDLETGEQTGLLSLPWSLAVHINAPQDAAFCIVSTFDPLNPDVRNLFHNAILRVALDGSGAEVLCYHSSDSSTYTGNPKATVSREGSRFVYASNGGEADGPVDTWLGVLPVGIPGPVLPKPLRKSFWGTLWGMIKRLFGAAAQKEEGL